MFDFCRSGKIGGKHFKEENYEKREKNQEIFFSGIKWKHMPWEDSREEIEGEWEWVIEEQVSIYSKGRKYEHEGNK